MKLKESVGYLISNTGRKLTQCLTQLTQDYNLTSEQFGLLLCLSEEDGISQKELSRRTEKDPANITRILDQLERKGFVNRVTNSEDRRSYHTYITKSGKEAVRQIEPIEAEFIRALLLDIPDHEASAFKAFMQKINKNIERYRERNN
ncbi:MarR family transcriptional regulator [Paenibacillus sediminis]|uniref:MarR family transcriptional regulator for hemolysin n=1 Tax=Paenibacillus sediminis TaxID=664909 RepID=A0ABS4H4S4_9BACL|nr:MarR family transcriptional regulator for hemolysin [Paenibacillus sediminis]